MCLGIAVRISIMSYFNVFCFFFLNNAFVFNMCNDGNAFVLTLVVFLTLGGFHDFPLQVLLRFLSSLIFSLVFRVLSLFVHGIDSSF